MIIDENYEGLKDMGYYYFYDGDLECDELEIKIRLEVGESLEVGGSLEVGRSLEVGGFKTIMGKDTSYLKLIYDIYHIQLMGEHIKIGCQFHSKESWSNFSDREILDMGGKKALKFWRKNKEWLLSYSE